MRSLRCAAGVAAMTMLGACRSTASAADVPAVIDPPDVASRAELREAVSTLLGGRSVLLADDALTKTSLLILERPRRRSIGGVFEPGRELEPPERFRLLGSDGRCVLVHLNTGMRHALTKTRCRAEGDEAKRG